MTYSHQPLCKNLRQNAAKRHALPCYLAARSKMAKRRSALGEYCKGGSIGKTNLHETQAINART